MWSWPVLFALAIFAAFIYHLFFSAPAKRNDTQFLSRFGPVALVTGGAAGGIGAGFALALAKAGFHVIITGRSEAPLLATQRLYEQESAGSASTNSGTGRVSVVAGVDMAAPDCVSVLDKKLGAVAVGGDRGGVGGRPFRASTDLGLLVLNHTATDGGEPFLSDSVESKLDITRTNVDGYTRLSHWFGAIACARGSGGLILMTSQSYTGSQYLSMYTASKAYQLTLARVLANEWRARGVAVTACVAGSTDTTSLREFYAGAVPIHHLTLSVDAVVNETLNALAAGQTVCLPAWSNKLSFLIAKSLSADAAVKLFTDQMPPRVLTKHSNAAKNVAAAAAAAATGQDLKSE